MKVLGLIAFICLALSVGSVATTYIQFLASKDRINLVIQLEKQRTARLQILEAIKEKERLKAHQAPFNKI